MGECGWVWKWVGRRDGSACILTPSSRQPPSALGSKAVVFICLPGQTLGDTQAMCVRSERHPIRRDVPRWSVQAASRTRGARCRTPPRSPTWRSTRAGRCMRPSGVAERTHREHFCTSKDRPGTRSAEILGVRHIVLHFRHGRGGAGKQHDVLDLGHPRQNCHTSAQLGAKVGRHLGRFEIRAHPVQTRSKSGRPLTKVGSRIRQMLEAILAELG